MRKADRERLAQIETEQKFLRKEIQRQEVYRIDDQEERIRALELERDYPEQCTWAKARRDLELKLALPIMTGDYFCPDDMITVGEYQRCCARLCELLVHGKKKGWIR